MQSPDRVGTPSGRLRILLGVVRDGVSQTLYEREARVVPERITRQRDSCDGMLDVACSFWTVHGFDGRAELITQALGQLIERDLVPAGDVVDAAADTGLVERRKIGVNDVP